MEVDNNKLKINYIGNIEILKKEKKKMEFLRIFCRVFNIIILVYLCFLMCKKNFLDFFIYW